MSQYIQFVMESLKMSKIIPPWSYLIIFVILQLCGKYSNVQIIVDNFRPFVVNFLLTYIDQKLEPKIFFKIQHNNSVE